MKFGINLPGKIQEEIIQKKLKLLCDQCFQSGERNWHGFTHQFNFTNLLLCYFQCNAKGRSHSIHQKCDQKTYGRKGEDVVQKNFKAVDKTIENLFQIDYSKYKIGKKKSNHPSMKMLLILYKSVLGKDHFGRR